MKGFKRKRGLVALLVLASVVVGLVVHTGTGTPSALGWRDIAAICPVGALEVLAGAKALLVHPIVLFAVVCVLVFLFGRSFCAWGCPVPHVRDFFHPKKKRGGDGGPDADDAGDTGDAGPAGGACDASDAGVRAATARAGAAGPGAARAARAEERERAGAQATDGEPLEPVGGERDGRKVDSRHFVLLGAVLSSFAFGYPVFCLVCPVGLSFAVVIGIWNLFRFNETSWGLIIFPLLILVEVVFFRKWCAKLCPIGALASLIASGKGLCRPRVDKKKCLRDKGVDCTRCVEACEERLDPHSESIPECTRCGACEEGCPAQAINMKLSALFGGKDAGGDVEKEGA